MVPVLGGSPDARDCDDTDADFRPYGEERCGDGIDQDCDGVDRPCGAEPGTVPFPDSGSRLVGLHSSYVGIWLAAGDLDGDAGNEMALAGHPGAVVELDRQDHNASAERTFASASSGFSCKARFAKMSARWRSPFLAAIRA